MTISENSQLGLLFNRKETKIEFIKSLKSKLENRVSRLSLAVDVLSKVAETQDDASIDLTEEEKEKFAAEEYKKATDILINDYKIDINEKSQKQVIDKISEIANKETRTSFSSIQSLIWECETSKYFFICDSVYKAAELIKIGENFTGRAVKNIKPGHYTYLMGKHKMVRFNAFTGAVQGIYWDNKDSHAFEFGLDLETGDYYAPPEEAENFSKIMQLITFIELGDIEVTYINALQSNGKPKNEGKVYNGSNNTVYVVDSTWNKLIIRTDGFAVRGHFRLQPCGDGLKDRKLIWINAFEKHGYTRPPRGQIVK